MYSLQMPRKIVFGAGAAMQLAQWLDADADVLLICGPSAVRNGLTAKLSQMLAPRRVFVFSSVTPEPTIRLIDAVRAVRRECGATVLLGVGGGSAMDVGKVAAAAGDSLTPAAEYFYGRAALPAQGMVFAALPTTAGTGAEVTPNGVFTDEETGIKQSIRGGSILPALAVVDPELTLSCPPAVTAASGMDALTQGIESYLSRRANNATRALALQAVKLIYFGIEKAWRDGGNLAARSDLSEGTMLGAMAFSTSGLGAVHGLAHPIGARYHLGHGQVCGILLPEILRWNLPAVGTGLDELSEALGLPGATALIDNIARLLKTFGMPSTLGPLGLRETDFDWIVRNSRSGSMKCNPREFSDDDLRAILRQML